MFKTKTHNQEIPVFFLIEFTISTYFLCFSYKGFHYLSIQNHKPKINSQIYPTYHFKEQVRSYKRNGTLVGFCHYSERSFQQIEKSKIVIQLI